MKKELVTVASAALVFASACGRATSAERAEAAVTYQSTTTPHTQSLYWSFDEDEKGGLPKSTVVFGGSWGTHREAGAPSQPHAFCQTSAAEFPAIALSDAVFSDVVLTARFKPISGRKDQAVGLIFRIQDQENYYVLRVNVLENTVSFYKYAGATRSSLQDGSAPVLSGLWHELRVKAIGNTFRGFLNGQPVVEATDDTYQAGQIGLWAKGESVTCFDEVSAEMP
jgi:hypothetical protein